MLLSTDLDADLVEMPPRTPPGFSVTQFFGQERREPRVPLSQGLVADLNTTLVEQFLNVTLTEWEAVVQPQSVTNNAEGKTVAIELPVGHGSLAYRH
ncbi:hypothetical protein DAETH_33210 (plasmid) [Deinococcus aetherius]|uniref:Uncharacterized protein n=1 Tax=Deinococcus aetherius TaxID=200252 RepID=A0ABN6RJ22_9DEIO|nr:hypothetical protein DAETH_33210 [Deinococcus aetherius]